VKKRGIIRIVAAVSYTHTGIWIKNWHATQEYCESFNRAVNETPPDPPLIILTAPYASRDFPLFSNDLNRALYFSRSGHLGRFSRLWWTGGLVFDDPDCRDEIVFVQRREPGVFDVSIRSEEAYFEFPKGVRVGDTFSSFFATLTITSLHLEHRVSAFTVSFVNRDISSDCEMLYFNGAGFKKIL